MYVDGDGLAYYCAGNEETTVAEARDRVRTKIDGARRACGASRVIILLTASGGHKGHRYAVARVKPYQGQRTGTRPKNWRALRDMLETGVFGEYLNYSDREADDGFGQFGWADPEKTVIFTQDKDMRMVPGYHLDWKDHRMVFVAPDTYELQFNDLVYGRKWFWLQMLQGDGADNIPGLPRAYGKQCGPVGASKILALATDNKSAFVAVAGAYQSYYPDDWIEQMLEQGILLWMRRDAQATWCDVFAARGPLGPLTLHPLFTEKLAIIQQRITQADELNATAQAQGE